MMKDGKRISLVIPTLNEAENLPVLLKTLPDYIDETIIVDGHSKDRTDSIARQHGCTVLFDNIGKGSALIKGCSQSSGDYIVMMDADLSHRPVELARLLKALGDGHDICMGSRFMKGGSSSDISLIRMMGNKFFVWLVNTLYRASYTDLCYGYRSFTREAFDRLNLRSVGFSIETEISIKAAKQKMNVLEVPSFEKRRHTGKGKLRTVSDGWIILNIILRELLR
jgi:glycosyltransferase involved in cell wall biosynthesis